MELRHISDVGGTVRAMTFCVMCPDECAEAVKFALGKFCDEMQVELVLVQDRWGETDA